MRRRLLLGAGAALAAAGAAGAAAHDPLAAFNALAPRDAGAHRIVAGLAYGEGPRRTLDLYAPKARRAPLATIVFFYGGGWSSGRREDYAFAATALAARGYLVAVPDYRLVPEVRFPAFLQDGAAAVRWTAANAARYGGDPRRIVLIGHSAGAYIAVMLALDQDYLRAAGADPRAIAGAAGLSGPYDFYPFDVEASRAAFGQAPDPVLTQPVHFARADAPPLLLIAGDADVIVRPRNTLSLAARLRALGAPVETRLYAGADHAATLVSWAPPLRGRTP
ncbi:MAG: alpha/beta hydrolase, partial [Hyphomonadaceae bacterium]